MTNYFPASINCTNEEGILVFVTSKYEKWAYHLALIFVWKLMTVKIIIIMRDKNVRVDKYIGNTLLLHNPSLTLLIFVAYFRLAKSI